MQDIQVIAFDADDTLWVNETYYRETEELFCQLLEPFMARHSVMQALIERETKDLEIYGYGAKGFMLSMIATAAEVTGGRTNIKLADEIIALGHELLNKPVVLLDGVEDVLKELDPNYRLVMATKGDLLDQERKLIKSGLEPYFHHIEIMSNKGTDDYRKLLRHLDCEPQQFLMVGNSVKSDV